MLIANSATQYPWAAIAVTNPNITVTNLIHLGNDNIVVAEIIKGTTKIYAISGYLSPSQDHTPVLETLSRALDRLRGSSVLIGIDGNAYSTAWGSAETNSKGESIEDFIAQYNLKILNCPSNLTTYCSSIGSSNIDITLASGYARLGVQNWLVEDGWTLSDHQVITFQYTLKTNICPQQPYIQSRYKTRLRCYKNFNTLLEQNVANLPQTPESAEDRELFHGGTLN